MFKFLGKHLASVERPSRLALLDFSKAETFPRIQTTSDSTLGGFSTAYFEPYRASNESKLLAHFHGNLNPTLPRGDTKVKQSGWAMFKTKNRIQDPNAQFKPFYLFKSQANFWWDFSPFEVLHLRVMNLTPDRKFMVNIQTDTMSRTDLYQHRLFTNGREKSGSPLWERGTVQVQYQSEFEKDRIKSVGISIADGKFGPFEILVDKIEVLSGYDYFQELEHARNCNETLLPENDENKYIK